MPYAGPRDGGASLFQAYAQGAQLKMQRREAAAVEKQRALQMELAKAANARAERLAVDQRQQDETTNYFRTQADSRATAQEGRAAEDQAIQRENQDATIKERKRIADERTAQGQAQYGAARFATKQLLTVHPELAQDLAEAQGFLQGPEGQKLTPEAKALYVQNASQALEGKVKALEDQKFQTALNDAFNTGAMNDPRGDGKKGAQFKALISDPKLTASQKMQALLWFQKEQSKNKATIEINQRGGMRLREQFLGAHAHVAHGSEQEDQITQEITNVEQGVTRYADAYKNIHNIINPAPPPKQTGAVTWADVLKTATYLSSQDDPSSRHHTFGKNDPAPDFIQEAIKMTGYKQPGQAGPAADAPQTGDAMAAQRTMSPSNAAPTGPAPSKYEADAQAAGSEARLKVLGKRKDARGYAAEWQNAHPGATKEQFKEAMKAAGFQ
jgi:hypothetical protein